MKSLFSLLALMVVFCSFSFATVRTVCNMPYSPGQYTDFTTAMNASLNFDTIYVQGSSITYGSILINKSLVIIGTGHHPDKQNPLVSGFLTIQIDVSSVQLIGLRFTSLTSGFGTINVKIKKCRILGSTSNHSVNINNGINWLIEGNIIESPSIGAGLNFMSAPSNNTIVRNNIFLSSANKIVRLSNSSTERTYFLNNIFLGNSGGLITFSQINYAHIENNIFYSSMPDAGALTNCLVNNNLSFASDINTTSQPGTNNLVGPPQFINYTGFQSVYNYDWDLSIDPASLGHNHGTDGTDLGVFGGLGLMFIETGEPSIAEITSFTITTPVIAPGGSLTISVTSKRVH